MSREAGPWVPPFGTHVPFTSFACIDLSKALRDGRPAEAQSNGSFPPVPAIRFVTAFDPLWTFGPKPIFLFL